MGNPKVTSGVITLKDQGGGVWGSAPPAPLLFSDNFTGYTSGITPWSAPNPQTAKAGYQWTAGSNNCLTASPDDFIITHPGVPLGSDTTNEAKISIPQAGDIWLKYNITIPSNYIHRDEPNNNNKWMQIYSLPRQEGLWSYIEVGRVSDTQSQLLFKRVIGGTQTPAPSYQSGRLLIDTADVGNSIELIHHFKAGDGASNSGIIETYKNGVLLDRIVDYGFYSSIKNYLEELSIMGYANSGYTQATQFILDDFSIASSDIWGVQVENTRMGNPSSISPVSTVDIGGWSYFNSLDVAKYIGKTITKAQLNILGGDVNNVRFALYKGGISDTDITGVTLVEDFQEFAPDNFSLFVSKDSLTAHVIDNDRYWIAYRGAGAKPLVSATESQESDIKGTVRRFENASSSAPWPSSYSDNGSLVTTFGAVHSYFDMVD